MSAVIRNYQGEVPEGEGQWYCEDCQFIAENLTDTAKHSDQNAHWLWLFLHNPSPLNDALFEVHESDYGGVYFKYRR